MDEGVVSIGVNMDIFASEGCKRGVHDLHTDTVLRLRFQAFDVVV